MAEKYFVGVDLGGMSTHAGVVAKDGIMSNEEDYRACKRWSKGSGSRTGLFTERRSR